MSTAVLTSSYAKPQGVTLSSLRALAWFYWKQTWFAIVGTLVLSIAECRIMSYYPVAVMSVTMCLFIVSSAASYWTAEHWTMSSVTSSFPSHQLRLPISTFSLVALPMFFGAAIMALYGSAELWFLDFVNGWHFPFYSWSLSMAVACLWVQAVSWWPTSNVIYRSATAVLIATLWDFYTSFAPRDGGFFLSVGILVCLGAAAICVALKGIRSVRQGASPYILWPKSANVTSLNAYPVPTMTDGLLSRQEPLKQFATASDAMSWFEWNANPTDALVEVLGIVYTSSWLVPILIGAPLEVMFSQRAEAIHIGTYWQIAYNLTLFRICFAVLLIATSPFYAKMYNSRTAQQRLSGSTANNYYIKPINCWTIASAQIKRVACAAVYGVPFALLGLLLPAHFREHKGFLVALLIRYGSAKALAATTVGLLLVPYLTWKTVSESVLTVFVPKTARVITSVALIGAFCVLFRICDVLLVRNLTGEAFLLISLLAALLTLLKLAAMFLIGRQSLQASLITRTQIVEIAKKWSFVAVVLSIIVASIVPSNLFPTWGAVALTLLLMPGVRMALTPMAVAKVRHQ
jgi:hypothetical protein